MAMYDARITRQGKMSTQSGKARADTWLLAFEATAAKHPDALMGWAGGSNTDTQITLSFPTREAAQAYASRAGLTPEIIEPAAKALIIQTYAENFR
jgi:hypothetical protein